MKTKNFAVDWKNLKIFEIFLIWMFILFFWHWMLYLFASEIANAEYLVWAMTTASVIAVCRIFCKYNDTSIQEFLGRKPKSADGAEMIYLCILNLFIGIGCWGAIVYFTAKINPQWAYSHWALIDEINFESIHWSRSWLVAYLLTGAIAVPIAEEIIFRGLILKRLRLNHNITVSILVSSGLFALFHINKGFVGSFFHAVIFAVVAVRFSSLYIPMLLHGIYNASVFLLKFKFGMLFVVDKSRFASFQYWAPEFAFLFISLALTYLYFRKAILNDSNYNANRRRGSFKT